MMGYSRVGTKRVCKGVGPFTRVLGTESLSRGYRGGAPREPHPPGIARASSPCRGAGQSPEKMQSQRNFVCQKLVAVQIIVATRWYG